MRYEGVSGGGFQAALTPACFRVLRRRLGVRMELFASPLNAFWAPFCSAFADVDAPFGSLGSALEFAPERGSFEARASRDAHFVLRFP